MAERGPALLGQRRHHGVNKPHQDVGRFPRRPSIVGYWLSLEAGERGLEGIGNLVDVGDADVEAQPFDVLGDARERAVGRLAQGERRLAEAWRARQIGGGRGPRRPPRGGPPGVAPKTKPPPPPPPPPPTPCRGGDRRTR